jgi:DNA-binding response OmpR family regulator
MAKILVVESEERLCMAITAYLKSQGADTITTSTAQKAVSMLDESQIDLVALDLQLNDGQGLELLRHIRESPALVDLPVIVMSAWNGESASYEYLEPGDYLMKPFDMRMLDWMIRRLLDLPQDQDLGAAETVFPKVPRQALAEGVSGEST